MVLSYERKLRRHKEYEKKYVTGKEELWRNINMREVHFPGRLDLYCLQLVLR